MAITAGSALGGLLFDANGYVSAFAMAALLLVLSAALSFLTSRTAVQV